jgi:hypothetical protein
MAEQDIDFIEPGRVVLVVDGIRIEVTPLLVKELPRVIRALDALIATLIYEGNSLDAPRLVALMGEHGEAIAEAVAVAVRQPQDWVDNLLPDRLVAMALAVVEVNADFFTRLLSQAQSQAPRLAPTLAAKIMAGNFAGLTPSTG